MKAASKLNFDLGAPFLEKNWMEKNLSIFYDFFFKSIITFLCQDLTKNKLRLRDILFFLYRSANQKLQDTNDGLVQMVDVSALRSPRPSKRNSRRGSQSGSESDSIPSRNGSMRIPSDRLLRVSDPPYGIR